MYHAEEIIISLFSAPARRITGQGDDTTYSVNSSWIQHYMLCLQGVALCGGGGRSVTAGNRICTAGNGQMV
ncbi:hypothetical protein BXO92_24655 (plasmid) [Escherichia coli]|nr:hypothetical protein BXO92_24655 [Escherichia coli]